MTQKQQLRQKGGLNEEVVNGWYMVLQTHQSQRRDDVNRVSYVKCAQSKEVGYINGLSCAFYKQIFKVVQQRYISASDIIEMFGKGSVVQLIQWNLQLRTL